MTIVVTSIGWRGGGDFEEDLVGGGVEFGVAVAAGCPCLREFSHHLWRGE